MSWTYYSHLSSGRFIFVLIVVQQFGQTEIGDLDKWGTLDWKEAHNMVIYVIKGCGVLFCFFSVFWGSGFFFEWVGGVGVVIMMEGSISALNSKFTLCSWNQDFPGELSGCFLMPWLLASPGHQQPWYWSYKIDEFLSYMMNCFNSLCHLSIEIK